MSKQFAVFDIDGTVARTSLFLATVHALKRRGLLSDAKEIDTALDKWLRRSKDQAFEEYSDICVASLRQFLPNMSLRLYAEVSDEVLDGFSHKIYRYTTQLIEQLHDKGYLIFAISGSENSIVAEFCRRHGFDDWIGNEYEVRDGYFNGIVGTTFRDKSRYVRQLIEKHACGLAGSIGVGDTHGDIDMLAYVENPIAFNPNKTLYEHAKKSGWDIAVERKNVIYKLSPQNGHYELTD